MDKLKNYTIVFSGLPLGVTDFTYNISQSFFELFEIETDFNQANFNVNLKLDKKSTMLELDFTIDGQINVPCDLTNENFDQKISNEAKLIIKFGDEYLDEDFDLWIIPRDDYEINVAQFIYEVIITSLPNKRVHPDVLNGNISPEMADLLDKYSIYNIEDINDDTDNTNDDEDNDDDYIDPRWDKLKNFKP